MKKGGEVKMQNENGNGLPKCGVCGKAFVDERALRIHVGMMHREKKRQLLHNLDNGTNNVVAEVPKDVKYEDWNGAIEILKKAYEAKLFVLIVGPKGTGKTTLVMKFAEIMNKPLYSINFSLRTKESHLVGTTVLENGCTKFIPGIIPRSMQEGAILYLDELNSAEADVLLRLDEALDDRREMVLKEAGEVFRVKAHPDWFVIATINPLGHAGTKELPPQLLSRFPVRLYFDYPPIDIEKKIVRLHLGEDGISEIELDRAIKLASKLRDAAKVEDIYYCPSIRETIAFAKLLKLGMKPREAAELVFANVYYQWSDLEVQKVKDLIGSLWGYPQYSLNPGGKQ